MGTPKGLSLLPSIERSLRYDERKITTAPSTINTLPAATRAPKRSRSTTRAASIVSATEAELQAAASLKGIFWSATIIATVTARKSP